MATPRALLRPLAHFKPYPIHHQRRTFLPNPFQSPLSALNASSQPQTLTATRTLPYPSEPIYSIVSDVSSYSSFLPYCQSSSITKWSAQDLTYARQWPSEAKIVVGWGNLTEAFTSRIFCVPGKIVESVGGDAETALPRSDIQHHLEQQREPGTKLKEGGNGLLTHLRSRWTIEAVGKEKTEVTLALEFAFANPLYMTLSAGAAPRVADLMIKAFEERVRNLLEGNHEMVRAGLGDLEGSRVRR